MSVNPKQWHIGFVGYGEVGRILAEELRKQDLAISAYDIKLDGRDAGALRDHAGVHGVTLVSSAADLAGTIRLCRLRGDREPDCGCGTGLCTGSEVGRLVSRLQLGVAGRQATRCGAIDGHGGRYVERGGDDIGAALSSQGAAAAWRRRSG